MYNQLGLSVYLSTFHRQKEMLERFGGSGYLVLASFHMQEEFNSMEDYCERAVKMCKWLKGRDFKIMGMCRLKLWSSFSTTPLWNLLRMRSQRRVARSRRVCQPAPCSHRCLA